MLIIQYPAQSAASKADYVVLLLANAHGEIMPEMPNYLNRRATISTVWDGYNQIMLTGAINGVDDATAEKLTKQGFQIMFGELVGRWGKSCIYDGNVDPDNPEEAYYITVQAKPSDMTHIFNAYAYELENGAWGGDDTIYDYWPSALQMLVHWADDLDQILHTSAFRLRAREVWKKRALDYSDNHDRSHQEKYDSFSSEVIPMP